MSGAAAETSLITTSLLITLQQEHYAPFSSVSIDAVITYMWNIYVDCTSTMTACDIYHR
jgi:hypothetical protein